MKSPTLKKILLDYLNTQENWVTKGQLGLIAEQNGYLPESCGRHLRKMAEEKEILVSYYKGKRNQTLSRYARLGELPPIPKQKVELVEVDGVMIARLLTN